MIDHTGLNVSDIATSRAFYVAALAPLGYQPLMDFEQFCGFGVPPKPDFWIGGRFDVPWPIQKSGLGGTPKPQNCSKSIRGW